MVTYAQKKELKGRGITDANQGFEEAPLQLVQDKLDKCFFADGKKSFVGLHPPAAAAGQDD